MKFSIVVSSLQVPTYPKVRGASFSASVINLSKDDEACSISILPFAIGMFEIALRNLRKGCYADGLAKGQ